MLISQSYARKYFGNVNPVGKTIYIRKHPAFKIGGVFKDFPPNLHLRNDVYRILKPSDNNADSTNYYLMVVPLQVRIPNPADVAKTEAALNALFIKNPYFGDTDARKTVSLDPVSKIHFMSGLTDDRPTASLTNIYAILLIGILLLLAALLNFINLLLLSWQKRQAEFAFRHAVGASRHDIYRQLLIEYGLSFLFAVLIGSLLYLFTFSTFSKMVHLDLQPYELSQNLYPVYTLLILGFMGSQSGLAVLFIMLSCVS
jgi:ABC-type antimicrobial peptide transport system permease subunit